MTAMASPLVPLIRRIGRLRRCHAIGAPRADRPHARRNLSFGKLACRPIGGAGSGTVGIEEATMHTAIPLPVPRKRAPWNKGRLIGQKRPLKPKDVWAIRVRLQLQGRKRDLALFNLAIDSKLRGLRSRPLAGRRRMRRRQGARPWHRDPEKDRATGPIRNHGADPGLDP
jgi:hypothetical protein